MSQQRRVVISLREPLMDSVFPGNPQSFIYCDSAHPSLEAPSQLMQYNIDGKYYYVSYSNLLGTSLNPQYVSQ